MTESLLQALQLTVVGMGMTFAAIGTLVAGMYLLTALTREPEEAAPEPPPDPNKLTILGITVDISQVNAAPAEAKQRAVAAAVAVAMAAARPAAMIRPTVVDNWAAYVRMQHVMRRRYHRMRGARTR